MRAVVIVLAGAVGALAAVYLGAWWAPFVVGAALGLLLSRARWSVPAGAAVGALAWTVPLVVEHVQYGLGPTATAIAAIMGLTGASDLPVALTILVGTLLGTSGAWLGSALLTTLRGQRPAREASRSGAGVDTGVKASEAVLRHP